MTEEGKASAWEVKQYLLKRIRSMRSAEGTGYSWSRVQRAMGQDAWAVWLMVENVTDPSAPPPDPPDDPEPPASEPRAAEVSFAEMEITDGTDSNS